LSDYRQLRSRVGLQRYSEAAMIAKLAAGGFTATRAHFNIGHNPWRMTFVAHHAFSAPERDRTAIAPCQLGLTAARRGPRPRIQP